MLLITSLIQSTDIKPSPDIKPSKVYDAKVIVFSLWEKKKRVD